MKYPRLLSDTARVLLGFFALVGFASALGSDLQAQQIPTLTGHVQIDLAKGALKSDVCLSAIRVRGDSLTLVLNSGFTIERINGLEEKPVAVEEEPGGNAKRYTYAGANTRPGNDGEPITDVCLRYSGTFPVYETTSGEYREDDESSLVAFNGRTLRARGISRWHPTIYDPGTNVTLEALSFDLEVDCATCGTLFVNGGEPVAGPSARFASDSVRELLLIAGDLTVSESGGITFIGESGPGDAGEAFAGSIIQISQFLEEFTGVPYGPVPDVIDLRAVRAPRPGQLWGFYSDPGLVLIGMTVTELEAAMQQARSRQAVLGFLAHELSHRYFGWTLGAGSAQRDFFGEPFAVYLELKAIRYFLGEEAYREGVERLRRRASENEWVNSLEAATADDFADAGYRYTYSPAMLFSLEERIGESAMRLAMANMLTAPPEVRYRADFRFLADAVRAAGVSEATWETWRTECLGGSRGGCP